MKRKIGQKVGNMPLIGFGRVGSMSRIQDGAREFTNYNSRNMEIIIIVMELDDSLKTEFCLGQPCLPVSLSLSL